MNISKFLSSLLPSFGKERVLEDLSITQRELEGKVLPEFKQLARDMQGFHYKNKDVKFLQGTFKQNYGGDMLPTIAKDLPLVIENIRQIEKMVNEHYLKDVAAQGLTFKNANLLQLAEYASFVSKYVRKLGVFVLTAESLELKGEIEQLNESITPADHKWVMGNMAYFCTALLALTLPAASLAQKILELPDAIASETSATGLEAQLGTDKLDPFKTRFIPVWLNPIYHVGMIVAEWQTARYKEAEEEMTLLQLRRLNLQRQKTGKDDAHLDDLIEKCESRIQTVAYKLAKMEKDYA